MSRCKCPSVGPNMGYLVSFGDCMTALLAFFIVLNALAREQTGGILHAGTGSFIRSTDSLGLPGMFPAARSKHAFQLDPPAPWSMVPDPEQNTPDRSGTGPDEIDDNSRILNRQKEQFHRFLQEMRRRSPLEAQPDVAGEVTFDILGKLPPTGSPLMPEFREALNGAGPRLRPSGYALEITVWATTPSQTAWIRAVEQADQLRADAVKHLRLNKAQSRQVTAVGRTWISANVKRPAASITLRRLVTPLTRESPRGRSAGTRPGGHERLR